ncbi:MAG: hypothetical protein ACP5F6_01090 [Microbacter sp.]
MNSFFNPSRYFHLVSVETQQFRKNYLYFGAVVILVALLNQHIGNNGFGAISVIILLIAPFIFYNHVYHSVKGLMYTMLPASNAEKMAACWTQCVVILPLFLWMIWFILRLINQVIHPEDMSSFINIKSTFSSYWNAIAAQSLSIFAVMTFRRRKWQKLIAILFIIAILGTIVGVSWLNAFQLSTANLPFEWSAKPWVFHYAEIILTLVFPFGFWLVSYFKLEEQEL